MPRLCPLRAFAAIGTVVFFAVASLDATANNQENCYRDFQPSTGQPGKDVVWVPTNDGLVKRMLEMADVKPTDIVYDLGAGDGKIAIAAARDFGARSVGVEYNPNMVKLARCLVKVAGVEDKAKIIQGDIFETDFSEATVVTLYLLPELNLRLRPTLLKMKPGTRIVSHAFLMDDWEPDESSSSEDGHAYFWIVPAQVAGTWTFRGPDASSFDVHLEQSFQKVFGTAGPTKRSLTETSLRGNELEFAFNDGAVQVRVVARVDGDRMDAQVTRDGKTMKYVGQRKG
ncbi:MAG: class I SAM-dependent methyltransferase [Gammaproteobacteria bacterium]|nr:class I SAM-dependent methyltransferase [Gammaproteobacteria bacterium]